MAPIVRYIPYPWADPEPVPGIPIDEDRPVLPAPVPLTYGPLYAPDRNAAEDVPRLYTLPDEDAVWAVSGSRVVTRVLPALYSDDQSVPQPIFDEQDVWWIAPPWVITVPLTVAWATDDVVQPTLTIDDLYPAGPFPAPQPLVYGPLYLPDSDTDDVSRLYTLPDEDAVWSVAGSKVQTVVLPSVYADDQSVPQPIFDDAETWQNWVAPVQGQNLVALPAIDDVTAVQPTLGIDEVYPAGPFPVPVPLVYGPLYLPDLDTDDVPSLYGQSDDDVVWAVSGSKVQNVVLPSLFADDQSVPQPVQDEDALWLNWVSPLIGQNLVPLPLPDLSETVPPAALPGDEDQWWQNYVPPVPAATSPAALWFPWIGGWTEELTSQIQEDFLVILVLDDSVQGRLYLPDADHVMVAPALGIDDDPAMGPILTQLGLLPVVFLPPLQAVTDENSQPIAPTAVPDDPYPRYEIAVISGT